MKTCTEPRCDRNDVPHTDRHMAYFHAGTDEVCEDGIIRGFEMEPYCRAGRSIDYLPLDPDTRHREVAEHQARLAAQKEMTRA